MGKTHTLSSIPKAKANLSRIRKSTFKDPNTPYMIRRMKMNKAMALSLSTYWYRTVGRPVVKGN